MIQAVIRPLASEDWNIATALVWRVFLRHNAPDYDQEGIGSFLNFISDEHLRLFCQLDEFRMYGAYLGEHLIGVCLMRCGGHVSLLFVETSYHKQGIGSELLAYVTEEAQKRGMEKLTVKAAPAAVGFYEKKGFVATGEEQIKDGVRFLPMASKTLCKHADI